MAQLGTMVTNVRRNLQELTANPGGQFFYSDANIKYFIGEAYRNYSLIMISMANGYFETVANVGITANDPTVSLSALAPTYFKLSVLRKNTPTGRFPLRSDEKRFTPTNRYGATSSSYTEFRYRFRGRDTIILDPVPTSTEAASDTTGLQVEYVYLPDFPVASSLDTFEFDLNFSPIFDPMIELYATIAMFDAKEGSGALSDLGVFRARLANLEQQFRDNLDQTEDPDSVQYIGLDYGYTYY